MIVSPKCKFEPETEFEKLRYGYTITILNNINIISTIIQTIKGLAEIYFDCSNPFSSKNNKGYPKG